MVVDFSAAERQSEKGGPGTEKCAGRVLSRIAAARGRRDDAGLPGVCVLCLCSKKVRESGSQCVWEERRASQLAAAPARCRGVD